MASTSCLQNISLVFSGVCGFSAAWLWSSVRKFSQLWWELWTFASSSPDWPCLRKHAFCRGKLGEAFTVFVMDEDARLGVMCTGSTIKGLKATLLLSSKTEMQNMIELSHRRFETSNLDIQSANANRSKPPPSSGVSGKVNLPTPVSNFNNSSPSVVTTSTCVHERNIKIHRHFLHPT